MEETPRNRRASEPRLRSGRRRPKPGSPPGTLLAPERVDGWSAVLWSWDAETVREEPVRDAAELEPPSGMSVWLEVTGVPPGPTMAKIGEVFSLHPLSLEDVVISSQRPKVEHYDVYDFIVLKALAISARVETASISIFLGAGFVVTFADGDLDLVRPVRARLRQGRGRIRQRGPDYLAYAVIDSAIDHYFPVVEELDDRIESAEARVLEPGGDPIAGLAAYIRRELGTIRHAVWPLRDVLASLLHDGGDFLTEDTKLYLRDSYDHVAQLQEMLEFSREVSAGLLEAYISTVSLETNRVIRVLTVIATIFMPITFITGVYGMNFDRTASSLNMPELGWRWGYPFSLGLMLGTGVLFLVFFRRRGWIGGSEPPRAWADAARDVDASAPEREEA